jgi:hypothetical protein
MEVVYRKNYHKLNDKFTCLLLILTPAILLRTCYVFELNSTGLSMKIMVAEQRLRYQ